jgi:hypothetical protein
LRSAKPCFWIKTSDLGVDNAEIFTDITGNHEVNHLIKAKHILRNQDWMSVNGGTRQNYGAKDLYKKSIRSIDYNF